MFIRCVVCLLFSVVLILGISFQATAANILRQALMVSVQVLDRSSIHKAAVRSTRGLANINTSTRVKEGKIIADYSTEHFLSIERGKNVTITGKVENPLPNGETLLIRSTASPAVNPYNISLSTTEQDLMATTAEGEDKNISNTYPFHYSLNTEDSASGEIQQTRPITVVLTVYY